MLQQAPDIFKITTTEDFEKTAFEAFYYQLANNLIYKQYVNLFKVDIKALTHSSQIPCLPIEFFKSKRICTTEYRRNNIYQ